MEIITRAQAKADFAEHYFTGAPCVNGHIERRRVSNGTCMTCERANGRRNDSKPERKVYKAALLRRRRKDPAFNARLNGYRRKRYPQERRAQRDWQFRKSYGITVDEYERMLAAQDGKCAICVRTNPSRKLLAVDHCHATGTTRKLLCSRCNTGLGQFKDDPALLRKAADYLEEFKCAH